MQSQQILKMSSSSPNAGTQASVPLVDGIVIRQLRSVTVRLSDLNQSLSQLVHVLHFFVVDPILHNPQILKSTGLRSGLFGGPRSGEMNAGVSRCSSLTVSRALCAGALSCWNTKKSPDTCCIAGNNC